MQRYDRKGAGDLNDSRETSSPDATGQRIGVERQGKRRDRRQRPAAPRSSRLTWLICVAASAFFAAPLSVNAQSYPSRPITVVVPFPAGGPSDVVARIVTEQMGKILGQSMVIENVTGAGGTIGSARGAAASPDGYTLLAGSMGSHVSAPVLTPNVKYDSERDFIPIGFTARAGRDRRKEGLPGQGPARIRGLSEEPRRRREAGARRHRLLVAHGVPPVHRRGRRAAKSRGLSWHRPGIE